jgi:all-trans-8'-apo-beta-carotenal 15,15'-oxygenase
MIAILEKEAPREGRWFRGLEGLEKEYERLPIRRVEGKLPGELRGVLFRNGPGRNEVFGKRNGHWFDGDGMIAAYRFDGASVTYSNRFVRTKYFENEAKARRMLYGGFATPAPSPFPLNLIRGMKNPANTNTMVHNGRLLALWEGGRPWSLDPETLTTLGEESFGGTLPRGSFFSAHPHRDQNTGGLINVGSLMGAKPAVQPWYVSPAGKAKRLKPITLDKAYMVHDFGLTASKIVILGGPFYVEPKRLFKFIFGGGTIFDCFTWHPEEPMVIYVADRDGQAPVRRYELPAAMLFHVANAYDQGEDVIVDAMLYDDDGALRIVADGFHGKAPTSDPGKLWRIRLGKNGTVTREPLCALGVDFARINERHESLRYRYAYPLVFEKGDFSSSKIAKVDVVTGDSVVHDFGAGCYAGEPVFVPRPGSSREDDGWVLSVVYDSTDHHSFVAVVPSEGFGQEDVRAHLPFHTPLGFHGNWAPA